jgi:hypothetical protein
MIAAERDRLHWPLVALVVFFGEFSNQSFDSQIPLTKHAVNRIVAVH